LSGKGKETRVSLLQQKRSRVNHINPTKA